MEASSFAYGMSLTGRGLWWSLAMFHASRFGLKFILGTLLVHSVPVLVGLALIGTCLWSVEARAQCGGGGGFGFGRQSVGGIFVDVDGVLEQIQAEDHERMRKWWEQ